MVIEKPLSNTFRRFFDSKKVAGGLLLIATAVSMAVANSTYGATYDGWWHVHLAGLSMQHWVNDALMSIFFLLIGLEVEREIYNGELSHFRNALLPLVAAIGGIVAPAAIHYSFNAGTPYQAGFGIPMATDIAFALAALALLGRRVPASLKVFLVALAVIDDLGAIVVIATFYSSQLSLVYLGAAVLLYAALIYLNKFKREMSLAPYLIGGVLLWYLFLQSGIHATLAGVLLAFAIPFTHIQDDVDSPSHRLEHFLHRPVSWLILPVFALANTGIEIPDDWMQNLFSTNSLGIFVGLVFGKPIGIFIASFVAVAIGICRLPLDLNWRHVLGGGMLGGIGFTMSIFISNLAFETDAAAINASKIAILLASSIACGIGVVWLRIFGARNPLDHDPDTMDLEEV